MSRAKVVSADAGDAWTWIGLDADTKLIASFCIGDRGYGAAKEFIADLADRMANRIQLVSDGHRAYLVAVEEAFGYEIDYAQLVKIYGHEPTKTPERRYSPAVCLGAEKRTRMGSTSARPMWNARTSPCACRCAGSRGLRMASLRISKTTRAPSRFTRCFTTFSAFPRR